MKALMAVFGIVLFLSCKESKEIPAFTAPEVYNSKVYPDYVQKVKLNPDSLTYEFALFMGKYQFDEKVDINDQHRESWVETDFLSKYKIEVFDSLDVNGFELVTDYEQDVYLNHFYEHDSVVYCYYPVYLVNSGRTSKMFMGQDSFAYAIQEANLSSWHPIEGYGFFICGDGMWSIIVHPGEFVVLLMRKYSGRIAQMRVRIKNGPSTYVSKPFYGKVGDNQTFIDRDYYPKLAEDLSYGRPQYWVYLGAIPKLDDSWISKVDSALMSVD